MKRMIWFVTALLLVFAFTGCGGQETERQPTEPPKMETVTSTEAPTEVPQTEPMTEPATEPTAPQTEPETEPPSEDVPTNVFEQYDVNNVNVPLVETIGNAYYADIQENDDGSISILYAGADQESLDIFLAMCRYSGLYRKEVKRDDGNPAYYLLKPGSDYVGYVCFVSEREQLYFQTMLDGYALNDSMMRGIMDYYLQDLSFPADFGLNVAPQFYASVNSQPIFQNMVGEIDHAFDGAMCWMEMYADISYGALEQYISDMLLCGFDIWYDYVSVNDSGEANICILHLSNGDLEVIVSYNAEDEGATVYYEPGVMMYLISGSDYAAYIPQR